MPSLCSPWRGSSVYDAQTLCRSWLAPFLWAELDPAPDWLDQVPIRRLHLVQDCWECGMARGKECIKLSGHHQSLSPVEGALGARKVLQCTFKVAMQESYVFKVWAFVIHLCYIDTNKIDDFIVGDGRLHLKIIRTVESARLAMLLPLRI